MKSLIITMITGLYLALVVGTVFAIGDKSQDVKKTAQTGPQESRIHGTVRSLPAGMFGIWNVNGRDIVVTKNTRIMEKQARADVGAYVIVIGTTIGNFVNAYKLEVKNGSGEVRKIRGTIESLTGKYGAWKVNGEEILVTRDTSIREILGKVEVGAYVEVEGGSSGNAFFAYDIDVKRLK